MSFKFPNIGNGICPHSPVKLFDPFIIFLLITIPPPVPEPRIIPKTILKFLADPFKASEYVKQLASFSQGTFLFKLFIKSLFNLLLFNHVAFVEFFNKPVLASIEPGWQTPTFSFFLNFLSRLRMFSFMSEITFL